jgi:hypothetical protein
MSLENKLRKPTQGQMPAAVVDELAAQPPQEPVNPTLYLVVLQIP